MAAVQNTSSELARKHCNLEGGPFSAPAALGRTTESPFLDNIETSFKNRHLPIVEGKIEVDELLLLYKQAKENVDTGKLEILAVDVPKGIVERFDERASHPRDVVVVYNAERPDVCTVVLYTDPSLPHALLHGTFSKRVVLELARKLGEYFAEQIEMVHDARTTLKLGSILISKGGDAGFLHRELLPKVENTNNAGSLIFEGAVHNENIAELIDEMGAWIGNPTVRVAIGIKVEILGSVGMWREPRLYLLAIEKTRDQIIVHEPLSFGAGTACNAAGLQDFTLSIQGRFLFEGTSDADRPELNGKRLTIDLYRFREMMYNYYQIPEGADHDVRRMAEHAAAAEKVTKTVAEWAICKGFELAERRHIPSGPSESAKRRRLASHLVFVGRQN